MNMILFVIKDLVMSKTAGLKPLTVDGFGQCDKLSL